MKIALLQTNIRWNDPQANIDKAQRLMASQPGANLYLLPEMWGTGFDTNPRTEAPEAALLLGAMQEMAAKANAHVGGSMAVEDNGLFFNRFYLVAPDGSHVHYDKRHLFAYGGEHLAFEPGKERIIARCGDIRILLLTCYDLRFPVFTRCRDDYDMIACIASWPEKRHVAWDSLLRARAIENQCVVCGVNRVGKDAHSHYIGGSVCINAYGDYLVRLGEKEQAAIAAPHWEKQHEFRKKFPVLADADSFTLNL